MSANECPLCQTPGGTLLLEAAHYRIIRAAEADYPGFCRVIWNHHVAEMSDLPASHQAALMQAVFAVERALRGLYSPDKVNLASLGNAVPHVHWHVIARRREDRHFPQPVWAHPVREVSCDWPPVSDETLRQAILRELATIILKTGVDGLSVSPTS